MNPVLVATSYLPPLQRLEELVFCLEKNLENPLLDEIHILVEEEREKYDRALEEPDPVMGRLKKALAHSKVTRFDVTHRQTYKSLFDHANAHLEGRIAVVSNADIWYDGTVKLLLDVDWEGLFVALTRTDRSGDKRTAWDSQDSWIFKAPLKEFPADWAMGPRGSDNKIAYEAFRAGYRVMNPCHSIRTYHVHKSGHRVGITTQRLPGNRRLVPPCAIEDIAKKP